MIFCDWSFFSPCALPWPTQPHPRPPYTSQSQRQARCAVPLRRRALRLPAGWELGLVTGNLGLGRPSSLRVASGEWEWGSWEWEVGVRSAGVRVRVGVVGEWLCQWE
jgi:hypothetical protein